MGEFPEPGPDDDIKIVGSAIEDGGIIIHPPDDGIVLPPPEQVIRVTREQLDGLTAAAKTEDWGIVLLPPTDADEGYYTLRLESPEPARPANWAADRAMLQKRVDSLLADIAKLGRDSSGLITLTGEDLDAEDATDDTTLQMVSEIRRVEKAMVPRLYQGVSIQSPIRFIGVAPRQIGPYSCTIATASYALEAMTSGGQTEESDLIEVVRSIEHNMASGISYIPENASVDKMVERLKSLGVELEDLPGGDIKGAKPFSDMIAKVVLESHGLQVRPCEKALDLIESLEKGSVAMISVSGHNRLIYGFSSENEQVTFNVIDPLLGKPSKWTLAMVVDSMNRYGVTAGGVMAEKNANYFLVEHSDVIRINAEDVSKGDSK
ncbi:MAG: hypothetical protein H7831_12340 [Magnetococcus sp. WYHC-3]